MVAIVATYNLTSKEKLYKRLCVHKSIRTTKNDHDKI